MPLEQWHTLFSPGESFDIAGFDDAGLFGAVAVGDEEERVFFGDDGGEQDFIAAGEFGGDNACGGAALRRVLGKRHFFGQAAFGDDEQAEPVFLAGCCLTSASASAVGGAAFR